MRSSEFKEQPNQLMIYDVYTHIQGLGNESITITDNVISSSSLETLDENTTGVINAESLHNRGIFTRIK